MARLTDHDVRDAEHALRMEVSLLLGAYSRRLLEIGKAHIQEALEAAALNEEAVNGTVIGRDAAERAAKSYFVGLAGAEYPAIEGNSPSVAS